MTEANPPVPKFASFRSKPSSTVAAIDPEKEDKPKLATRSQQYAQKEERPRNHRRHHRSRSREHHRSRSKEKSHARDSSHRSHSREKHRTREKESDEGYSSRRRSRSRDDRRSNSRRPLNEEQIQRSSDEVPIKHQSNVLGSETASDIYVVDRKGDVKNLLYGSNHRYSVPPFHRIGAGRVLGAPQDTKIDREHSDDKGIVLANLRDFRYNNREKYIFSKVERDRPRLLKIRSEVLAEKAFLHDEDFVPLQTSRGKKRKRVDRELGSNSESDHDDTHYRSIQGKAKTSNQPQDDAFQYASDSDSSGSDAGRTMRLESSIKQKNIELSRRIEGAPNDVDAWLALIEHQDTLLKAGDERRRITNAEIRSTADIKIHMYEKALDKIHDLQDREKLLLGLMAEGAKIWEIKVQAERWAQIAKDNINSLVLWKKYLDFRQSNFSTFRYEDVREVFLSRIRSLKDNISAAPEWSSVKLLYEQLLYVVLRATIFIRESGFTELAVAIWQGVLEINFEGQVSVHTEHEASGPVENRTVELFGEFWEAEVPRVGEPGSLGWKVFAATGDDSKVPTAQTDEPEMSLNGQDLFQSWVIAESSRSKASRVPARTMDDTVEDDPYRVILFTDIDNFLVRLPRSAEYLRRSLLNAFLIFCHLPSMPTQDHESSVDWGHDSCLYNEMLDYDSGWVKEKYLKKKSTEESIEGEETKVSSVFETPTANLAIAPESMFSNGWFSSFKPWREVYGNEDNGPISYSWVRNTLKQLTQSYPIEDLAEYYMAFEWINEPVTIKKVAKTIIKQHSSSLKLYNAYAMIEWSKGNQEISNGIYTAALGMNQSMTSAPELNDNKDSVHLWKSLIWANISTGARETALSHLLSIPHGIPKPTTSTETTPTALLKTQQHLSSARDYFLTTQNHSHAVLYTELLALLKYLTTSSTSAPQSPQQGNITSALEILTAFSTQLSSRLTSPQLAYPLSLLHQSTARLLHHHAKSGPYRPQTLHSQLTTSLRLFPNNTIFFSLLTSPTIGITKLVSPVTLSTLFSDLLHGSNSSTHNILPLYLNIIHHYLQNTQSASPNLNTINSTFVSALNIKGSKSNLDSGLASSSALWRLYLLFCDVYPQFLPSSSSSTSVSSSKALILQSGSSSRENVREEMNCKANGIVELWKQAIARTPWCKGIYMAGFERICEMGDDDGNDGRKDKISKDEEVNKQLKHIWRVMGEKEVRVHVDLEGVWDEEE